MGTIKVLKIEPNKSPVMVDIKDELHDLQEAVGGYIECIYPFDDNVGLVCNEEGKLTGLEPNRVLRDDAGNAYDVVCGTFLIVGLSDDGFASLDDSLADKYTKLFEKNRANPVLVW